MFSLLLPVSAQDLKNKHVDLLIFYIWMECEEVTFRWTFKPFAFLLWIRPSELRPEGLVLLLSQQDPDSFISPWTVKLWVRSLFDKKDRQVQRKRISAKRVGLDKILLIEKSFLLTQLSHRIKLEFIWNNQCKPKLRYFLFFQSKSRVNHAQVHQLPLLLLSVPNCQANHTMCRSSIMKISRCTRQYVVIITVSQYLRCAKNSNLYSNIRFIIPVEKSLLLSHTDPSVEFLSDNLGSDLVEEVNS